MKKQRKVTKDKIKSTPKKSKTTKLIKTPKSLKTKELEKTEVVEVKKRGRPKKEIVEKKKEETIVLRSITFKHMGYCNGCDTVIGEIDCEGKYYKCKACGDNSLIDVLKKERKLEKRSKKEDWEWINSLSTSLKED